MTNAQAIIDRAASFGIQSKLWAKGDKVRIYASTGRKDASVFLELDGTADEVEGAAFKCFIDAGRQSFKWAASQRHIVQAKFIGLFHAYVLEMYQGNATGYGADIAAMIADATAFEAAIGE